MKDIRIPDSYELIERRTIKDLQSEGLLLRHKKTRACVSLLCNDDDNKVFYIGFRTPPGDSKGVAHIVEHTVLCGSELFPVKDPFMQLVKGSLNTFLNAMTYPDKTVYPVASCNDADFKNLMRVYMDAVFRPRIYRDRRIFQQEGWHYEMEDESSDLVINGVVYNEMKGSMSSPDSVMSHEMRASLFPDTTYGILSGGDPEVIPFLTYEEYLEFHRRYYHPTNSYIYLYGDIDVHERLTWIDEAYLSGYDILEIDSMPKIQTPFAAPKEDLTRPYAVMPGQSTEKSTYLSYNICAEPLPDAERHIALDVLDYALCDAPGALLKTALIDAGIGSDIYSAGASGILQPAFSVVAKGAEESQREEFIRVIRETLSRVVREGFDEKALYAGINQIEFHFREADYGRFPKGLMYGLHMLDSWLYDDARPFMHIEVGEVFSALKKKVKEGYFEELIRHLFLDNPHRTVLALVPEQGLTEKKEEALKDRLAAMRSSMTRDEIEAVVKDTKDLREWQDAPDDEEDLKKIPMLSRADMKKEAEPFFNELIEKDGLRILHHDIATNGVLYVNFLFDMERVPKELYPYAGILKTVLGMIDTKEHDYTSLAHEVNIHTGGLTGSVSTYSRSDDPGSLVRTFEIGVKVLKDELECGLRLVREILTSSDYTSEKRLKEILDEIKSRMQDDFADSGHQTAALRGLSHVSRGAKIADEVNGLSVYRRIEALCAEDMYGLRLRGKLTKTLKKLSEVIFRKENLLIDFTAPEEELAGFIPLAASFADALFTSQVAEGFFDVTCEKKNEAFRTAGQVQYVARVGNFRQHNLPYTGRLRLLKSILSTEYLWQNIRVRGGAYGSMCGFAKNGDSFLVSYRDPHLKQSLRVFEEAAAYIAAFDCDERQMTQYIIGAISELDQPKPPASRGTYGLAAYLTGTTYEELQKDRDELLSANAADIRPLSAYLDALIADDVICVVGAAQKIESCAEIFDTVESLIRDEGTPE
ncbi:MAG: insulinase family protein [Lachnospiraceae bacterium]|nr:insulinase family protein [Lachnospiraceae bacterium]